MPGRLLWKLLAIHVLVIGLVILVVWLTIDYLAADYFMALMKQYKISPTDVHQMFLHAAHRYLLGASIAALVLAVVLSLLLTRRLLSPLGRLIEMTSRMSSGDYSVRVDLARGGEFTPLATAFNRMADSLERIEQMRKTMVVDVAHELRTPLTNIRGYLEALSDGVIPHSTPLFQSLHEETLRLVKLVDDLAQLARADAARLTLRPQAASPHTLVTRALELARTQFDAKQIAVHIVPGGGGLEVVADPRCVAQAANNLLQNAWQYTPAGGTVRVSFERLEDEVKVAVANIGDGIAPGDLPFIFERFYRGEKSRSRELGGAGIGLAIVKELIEAHGGRVGASSSASETNVWFTLPV